MPMPKKKSLCKSKKFSVDEFCNSLISTHYYKQIKTTPMHECLRLVAFNYFNISIRQSKDKKIVKSFIGKCRKYLSRHASEIDQFFTNYYNGPKLDFPKKFKLNFTYFEIFQKENVFNFNLRNNLYDKFQNINHICILTDHYKNIKVNKPYVVIKFNCCFPDCPASYNFLLENDILIDKSELVFNVEQQGPILHRKGVTKANFISKHKRTELAKKLIESKESADNLFYNMQRHATDDFLDNAANSKKFTPTKEVIRKIKTEYNKKLRLDPCPIM